MNGPEVLHTLLLVLDGPMQSWGTTSQFTDRDTGFEPSKSGVIGLVCAALGRPRSATVDDLVSLRMGVRIDREGTLAVDYQTAGGAHRVGDEYGVILADGKGRRPVVSTRHYLAHASFLVGLEGTASQLDLLNEIDEALDWPRWPLALGRKAFAPGRPVALRRRDGEREVRGVRAGTPLLAALHGEPEWPQGKDRLRFVIEQREQHDLTGAELRMDQPGPGAAFQHRRFLPRYVRTCFLHHDDPPEEGA